MRVQLTWDLVTREPGVASYHFAVVRSLFLRAFYAGTDCKHHVNQHRNRSISYVKMAKVVL